MKTIPLRRRGGGVHAYVLVDDADYEWLNQWRWSFHVGYASRSNPFLPEGRIYMHRLILGLEKGDPRQCDHTSRNKLDNRRSNLMVVTRAENYLNHPGYVATSAYRGVSWHKARSKWRTQIVVANKAHSLGYYESEEDAAAAVRAFLISHGLPEEAVA